MSRGHGSGFAPIPLLGEAGSFGDGYRKGNMGWFGLFFFWGGKSSGKPWKNPFQKCPEKGEEQDEGNLQITRSASSPRLLLLGQLRSLTVSPPTAPLLAAAMGGPGSATPPRTPTPARFSGCLAPPELPNGLRFPALPGLAAAAAGSPSRCDS